jgi:hypothetical protein
MSYPICPKCNVRVPVDTSYQSGESQVRYHKCKCGYSKTTIVNRQHIWPRSPRKVAG